MDVIGRMKRVENIETRSSSYGNGGDRRVLYGDGLLGVSVAAATVVRPLDLSTLSMTRPLAYTMLTMLLAAARTDSRIAPQKMPHMESRLLYLAVDRFQII
ncbi:hypothetical protein G7046_g4510 [Stylonectria norvegica]|nr:hypothetical protein G7046_g4510 [Stylonectria norvegica]